ncbi:hypothetical protein HPB50_015088 [Hyalomma asiaticum]|uniref:Uncharacterized protein n=1 Tax=Hyalomma asiaticum TaxID=266040 RepID=A0ACB7TAN8_HYAAI|nr:hypothetical protein HPB50_015088 [Hyalomma asiaticum]
MEEAAVPTFSASVPPPGARAWNGIFLSFQDLHSLVATRLNRDVAQVDMESYLNGDVEGDFRATATQMRSVWTEARNASRRVQAAWGLDPENVRLTCGDVTLTSNRRREVVRALRPVLSARGDRSLHGGPNQGKCNFITERSPWWGCVYQRVVQTINALKRYLVQTSLSNENMVTGWLRYNCHPLTKLRDNTVGAETLTLSHFLNGQRISWDYQSNKNWIPLHWKHARVLEAFR